MGFIYQAIHYAGPTLTAQNVKKGLFAVPSTGGASDGTTNFQQGFGRTVGMPYDEYALLGTDRNLAWWNPDITGGANAVASIVGKGKFMYLDGGKRYAYSEFPTQAAEVLRRVGVGRGDPAVDELRRRRGAADQAVRRLPVGRDRSLIVTAWAGRLDVRQPLRLHVATSSSVVVIVATSARELSTITSVYSAGNPAIASRGTTTS